MSVSALQQKGKKGSRLRFAPLFNEAFVESVLRLTDPAVKTTQDAQRALASLGGKRTQSRYISLFDVSDWEKARDWLRLWLPRVRSFENAKPQQKAEIVDEINEVLYANNAEPRLVASPDGLAVDLTVATNSAWSAAALAMLPFIAGWEEWPSTRLAQCRYLNCGRWFLRPPPRRGSQPEYCSPSHASSERVRRFRVAARKPK